jgi:hypothetical protein
MTGTGKDGAIRSRPRALVIGMACSRVDCMEHLANTSHDDRIISASTILNVPLLIHLSLTG